MESFNLMIDLIGLGCGLYCMYTWLRLMLGGRLFKNSLLVPKEKSVEDCLDEAGYVAYMKPRLAVLAIVTLIYGVCLTLNDTVAEPFLPYPWYLVPLVVVLGVLIWYAVCNSRANRDFFGM